MRINKFLSHNSNLSRRKADQAIEDGRVKINGHTAELGSDVTDDDLVTLDDSPVKRADNIYLILNKPKGYIVSRKRHGNDNIVYDLLPDKYAKLKPSGRLDKDSRGLMIFTNDGDYIQKITHPSYDKQKVYIVQLDNELNEDDLKRLHAGVELDDGLSKLKVSEQDDKSYKVTMTEGRNRQIRRTFSELEYEVVDLLRIRIGKVTLPDNLSEGSYRLIDKPQ